MPNVRYDLTGEYTQVKDTGVISTLRLRGGGMAKLVESANKPGDDAEFFPMYERDQPFTFASNMAVWAKGAGTIFGMESAPE